MRNPKTNYLAQSLALFIFISLLSSSYAFDLSRSGSETAVNTTPAKELKGSRTSYEDYAAFIAGIRAPQSVLAPFEKDRAWIEFAKSCDRNWDKYDRKQLAAMREWAAKELVKPMSSGLTILYPLSGPDFINPYTFFPNAGTYVLMALEPTGEVPDFKTMSEKDIDAFLPTSSNRFTTS